MNARFLAVAFALASASAPAFALADTPSGPSPFQNSAFAGSAAAQPDRYNVAHGAPADRYFGSQHLSVLGIRNRIHDVALKMDVGVVVVPEDAMHDMRIVEEAIRDWESQYPTDSWLPRMVLALHHVYSRIGSDEASQHAVDVAAWLTTKYPESHEAADVRSRAAQTELAGDQ